MKKLLARRNLVAGVLILASIGILAAFVVPHARGAAVSNNHTSSWINGYVKCLDGTPIPNAIVTVTYRSDGDVWHPPIYDITGDNGYYSFYYSDFEAEPDYGVITALNGFRVHWWPFHYVPYTHNFHFVCGDNNSSALPNSGGTSRQGETGLQNTYQDTY